jgi:hypothetical protein
VHLLRHINADCIANNHGEIKIHASVVLRAMEENFGGLPRDVFRQVAETMFAALREKTDDSTFTLVDHAYRSVLRITKSMFEKRNLSDDQILLQPRYKLLLDPSMDCSSINLLFQLGVLDRQKARVIRVSKLPEDNTELRAAEVVSTIRSAMASGETVVLVNGSRVHGSLYDLYNRSPREIPGEDGQRLWYVNLAVGSFTLPSRVHPNFQIIVHLPLQVCQKFGPDFLSTRLADAAFAGLAKDGASVLQPLCQDLLVCSGVLCRQSLECCGYRRLSRFLCSRICLTFRSA